MTLRVLLLNDDGYLAPGILALYKALSERYEVTVVAPESDRSGISSALTLDRPIALKKTEHYGFYFVSGTPADCGHLVFSGALGETLDRSFDWVLSGINNGANLGDDMIYSGTLGAATEGRLVNIPSIAFSLVDKGYEGLEQAAWAARDIFEMAQEYQTRMSETPIFWNVNIPNRLHRKPDGEIDFVFTQMGQRYSPETVEKIYNPKGELMFWIGPVGEGKHDIHESDFAAVVNNKVSITPVSLDKTDHVALAKLKLMSI
jgi:5'-nucleotidase